MAERHCIQAHHILHVERVPEWAKLIDKTLATAMTLMISKAANAQQLAHHAQILERQVGRDRHRARQQGWSIRGQQIFWLFLRHYKTSDRLGHVYGIYDLAQIQWLGDNKLSKLGRHGITMSETSGPQPTQRKSWKRCYLNNWKSAALQVDIAYYRRIHQNHTDKSYGFLYRALCREMHLQALKRNRTAEEHMRNQQTANSLAKQPGVPAAPGAEAGGQ